MALFCLSRGSGNGIFMLAFGLLRRELRFPSGVRLYCG